MSHRRTSALVLLTADTLAMTAVTTPAAFAANPHEESQSGAGAPASSVDVQSGAQQSGGADEAGDENPTTTPESVPTDDAPTTIIVQLEDGSVGIPWYQRIFGLSSSTKHETVKERIETWVEAVVPGADITDVRLHARAGRLRDPSTGLVPGCHQGDRGRQGRVHRASPQADGGRG